MMKPYELLRQLRLERGLSQKELAEGIVTRTTISNYETGKNNISLEVLLLLLEKLNLTIDEFTCYLKLDKVNNKNQQMNTLLEKSKHTALSCYSIAKFKPKTSNSKNMALIRDYLIIKANNWYSLSPEEQTLTKNDQRLLTELMNHLDTVTNWGRFEMTTFSSLLFFFNTNYIHYHILEIDKKIKNYPSFNIFQSIILALYNNSFLLMLERKEVTLAKEYLTKFHEHSKTMVFSREHLIVYLFYKNLILHIEGNEIGTTEINKIFEALSLLDFQQMINEFKEDLKKFESLYLK